MNQEKHEISPAIKEHFEIIKVMPGKVKFGGFVYDLRNISLQEAEKLEKLNFPYLKRKTTAGTTVKPK